MFTISYRLPYIVHICSHYHFECSSSVGSSVHKHEIGARLRYRFECESHCHKYRIRFILVLAARVHCHRACTMTSTIPSLRGDASGHYRVHVIGNSGAPNHSHASNINSSQHFSAYRDRQGKLSLTSIIYQFNTQIISDIRRNPMIVDSSRRGRCAPWHPTHFPGRSILESQLGADTKVGVHR